MPADHQTLRGFQWPGSRSSVCRTGTEAKNRMTFPIASSETVGINLNHKSRRQIQGGGLRLS
jgi:hypothetical protein